MDQKITSRHFLFTDSRWMDGLPESGSIRSVHQGFIWENPGCPSFDDYLETFSSGQRRNIRKERSFLNRQGFKFLPIPGEDADKRLMDWMYRYYEHTNDQHGPWSCKYLKPAFFDGIHRRYRHRLLFMAAYHERLEHIPVGISMLIHKGPILLGRYWGSIVPVRHLHFNVCYYEPIVWAIRQGVTRFDPGLGGAHKIRRGFQAVPTYSLHRFYDSRLNHLVGLLIQEENRDAISHITDINAMLPFSRKENREYGKDQM